MAGNWGYEFNENLITPREHKRLMRDLNYLGGNIQKYERLPGHFAEGADRKYHYKKRTSKYLARKRARFKEERPDLVARGKLAADVIVNSKVTATWDHWRVYVRQKAIKAMPDWMRKEIEKMNKDEIKEDCRRTGKLYKQHLPQYLRKRRMKSP